MKFDDDEFERWYRFVNLQTMSRSKKQWARLAWDEATKRANEVRRRESE